MLRHCDLPAWSLLHSVHQRLADTAARTPAPTDISARTRREQISPEYFGEGCPGEGCDHADNGDRWGKYT